MASGPLAQCSSHYPKVCLDNSPVVPLRVYSIKELTVDHQPEDWHYHCPLKRETPKNGRIPPEDYENFELVGQEGTYWVEALCWDDGDLTVYQIKSDEGKRLQAQQFEQRQLPKNLYSSRKRRIHRLRKSQKIVETIELDGVKVFVTPVPEGPVNPVKTPQGCEPTSADIGAWQRFSPDSFPPLTSRGNEKRTHKRSSSFDSNSSDSDAS